MKGPGRRKLYHDRGIFTAQPEAIEKKLHSTGGFRAASSLTHMNRQKIDTPGKQNRNQTLNNKKQCKPKNQ
jgi:hypothetical protein